MRVCKMQCPTCRCVISGRPPYRRLYFAIESVAVDLDEDADDASLADTKVWRPRRV
jgi:hypothetical protein